jgi:hypothetical protein
VDHVAEEIIEKSGDAALRACNASCHVSLRLYGGVS